MAKKDDEVYNQLSAIIQEVEGYSGEYIAEIFQDYQEGKITSDHAIISIRTAERKFNSVITKLKPLRFSTGSRRRRFSRYIKALITFSQGLESIIKFFETNDDQFTVAYITLSDKASKEIRDYGDFIFKDRLKP